METGIPVYIGSNSKEGQIYQCGVAGLTFFLRRKLTRNPIANRKKEVYMHKIKYDKTQQSAISAGVDLYKSDGACRILPICGGAGTGKSSSVTEIIRQVKKIDQSSIIRLAAPTGQAGVVLNKMLKKSFGASPPIPPASTIHRMLGCQGPTWAYNRYNKLPCDLLVVDESSMLDVEITERLVSSTEAKIIMLGDDGQLPPVGAGAPFRDLVNAGIGIRFKICYRQLAGSMLFESIELVRAGKVPIFGKRGEDSIGKGMLDDCFWHEQEDTEKVAETLAEIIHPWHRDNKSYMLVVPQRVGPVGFLKLNPIIQSIINPGPSAGLKIFGQLIKAGDIVRQQKNNYKLGREGVFNGFLGKVLHASPNGITVEYPGWPEPEVVVYHESEDWNALTLGYAITGHASQGSQADNVCCLVHPSNWYALGRQWLYVAMSRAQKECHVVGTERALKRAVGCDDAVKRNTYMALAFEELAGKDAI